MISIMALMFMWSRLHAAYHEVCEVEVYRSDTGSPGWWYETRMRGSDSRSPIFRTYKAMRERYLEKDYNPDVLPSVEEMSWKLLSE